MSEGITTIALPKSLRNELENLKLSSSQKNYEVIEALLRFFKAKGGNKAELWVIYSESSRNTAEAKM